MHFTPGSGSSRICKNHRHNQGDANPLQNPCASHHRKNAVDIEMLHQFRWQTNHEKSLFYENVDHMQANKVSPQERQNHWISQATSANYWWFRLVANSAGNLLWKRMPVLNMPREAENSSNTFHPQNIERHHLQNLQILPFDPRIDSVCVMTSL